MDPQQPSQPAPTPTMPPENNVPPAPVAPQQPPAYTPPTVPGEVPPQPKSHTKLALLLLIGPTALLLLAIICGAVMNFIISSSESSSSSELFAQPNPIQSAVNIVLYLAGAIGILSWLPGIIIGIILLAKKK